MDPDELGRSESSEHFTARDVDKFMNTLKRMLLHVTPSEDDASHIWPEHPAGMQEGQRLSAAGVINA